MPINSAKEQGKGGGDKILLQPHPLREHVLPRGDKFALILFSLESI